MSNDNTSTQTSNLYKRQLLRNLIYFNNELEFEELNAVTLFKDPSQCFFINFDPQLFSSHTGRNESFLAHF